MIPKDATFLIDAIKSTGKKLAPAESGFIASVSVQTKANRMLTDKQSKWLQGIYGKVTGGGQYANREFIQPLR